MNSKTFSVKKGKLSSNSTSLSMEIRSFGTELGFNQVGMAIPDTSIWGERFLDWLGNGLEGEMKYMTRDPLRRTDPGILFPEVTSIVVVSVNYYPGEGRRKVLEDPLKGYIANYSLNYDYHQFMAARLQLLLQHIRQLTGNRVHGRIYVDTGPVLEKPFAVMAGLGWMGKQTLLISDKWGSWSLLGVLLLDAELEPDDPVADLCGDCTRCIEACPTQAITAPYRLDARRCISYLVGELKGSIPEEMRPMIGNRIFGCDDCQWACPWNRIDQVSEEPAFRPREELAAPNLMTLAEMDEDRFNELFYDNPIGRLRRKRFLRNIAVAIGNSGNRGAIPALEKQIGDADPLVREHLEWALKKIG